ncbi:MAG: hypothetical protein HRT69_16560, partial [Flavobacteriaceae bacterium]|nr:hypothetical protein [Flavobacteriaceae bacterium]
MKKIIALLFVIAPLVTFGQLSTNENYIHTISYTKAFTDSTIGDATEADRIEGVTYYDGIGRAKQSIAVGQGGNKEHVIKHYEYDNVGRQAKSYLPFAMEKALTNKLIVVNPLQENMGFYKTEKYEDTDFPYSQTEYENTTLSRPINIASPGEAWNMSSGHTTKVSYLSNLPEDGVLNFDVIFENNDLAQPKLNYRGSYDKNQLFKTEIKNENWTSSDKENQNIVYNFSDKFGRTILTRAFTETTDATTGVVTYMPVDTYNVYDDYGNLTYVLSPKAVNHLFSSNILVDYNTISISNTALATGTFSSKRGNISASIALDDSQLTFNFISNLRYDGVLKTGKVFEIPMPTPNVSIGEAHGYTFSVLDNHLDIQGSANLSRISVNETFTVDIPAPEVSIDNLVLYNLAYQYKYDVRNRLIERKVPNAGWESIVYDKLNRPVLTQDAKLANQNKWLYVKYDVFNRPVYTGMYTSVESREVLQDSLDNQTVFNEEKVTTDVLDGTNINYSHNVFPTTGISLLSINYYDEYVSGITTPTSVQTLGQTITNTTTGLVTETKERILGTDEWISSIVYYDVKGQPIFTSSTNTYLNTTDEVVILYDFVGNVEETIHKHTFFPINLIVITEDVFAYDHQNRMLTHHQTIKDDTGIVHIEELIEKNTYDELGRVTKVSVGNSESSPLQEVDYTFNIRGWLKRINNPNESLTNDVFAMEINYNTITKDVNNNAVLNNKALFNGNISEIISKTASDDKKRAYGYTYDNLNRLTSATYKAGDNFDQEQNFYNLNSVSYDENGNIKHLSRNAPNSGFNGALQIDDLNYEYFPVSNQLKKVIDLASNADGFDNGASGTNEDYIYDVNGNVTADNNKGISTNNPISFNYLNLPETITVTDKGTINFVYSASGKKQKKTVVNTTTGTHETVYAGKFIYTKDDAIQNYTLKFFSTSQGYVEPNAIGYAYVYQYKDHQGNIRVSYSDVNTDGNVDILRNGIDVNGDSDNRNEIVQAKNYYPFGLDHNYDANSAMSLVNGTIHKYKYNGQEQLKDLGLNVTEMTWRQY